MGKEDHSWGLQDCFCGLVLTPVECFQCINAATQVYVKKKFRVMRKIYVVVVIDRRTKRNHGVCMIRILTFQLHPEDTKLRITRSDFIPTGHGSPEAQS